MKNNLDLPYKWFLFKNKIRNLIPYSVENFYYSQISCRIWPRNKYLTKIIPKTWRDKPEMMEQLLFEMLKDYVINEIGEKELFDKNRWSKNDNVLKHQLIFERDLRKHYLLLTKELPKLESALENEWKKIPHFDLDDINNRKDGDYEKIYGKVNKAAFAVEELKDRICLFVVQSRKSMWT